MIARDAVPIGHDPVYKRIDLGATPPRPEPARNEVAEAHERSVRLKEGERLWRLVQQSAGDRTQEPAPPQPAPAPEFPEWGGFC